MLSKIKRVRGALKKALASPFGRKLIAVIAFAVVALAVSVVLLLAGWVLAGSLVLVIFAVALPGLAAYYLGRRWLTNDRRKRMNVPRCYFTGNVGPAIKPVSAYARKLLESDRQSVPVVTVVVPMHDEQPYIRDALTSIATQTFAAWRCVVVDDGSTDSSLDIAWEFARADDRFSIITTDEACGLSAARNVGTVHAATDFVTYLDGDDVLLPRSLEGRIAALTDDATQAGSFSDWMRVSWDAPLEQCIPTKSARNLPKTTDYVTAGWDTPFIATAPIIRTDLVTAVGGFDESLTTAEDMDFYGRLLRGGVYFRYTGRVDIVYRAKPQSMISRTISDHLKVAMDLARWRNSDWQPWAGAPMPYSESLDEYLRDSQLLKRALYSLALAVSNGAPAAAVDELVTSLRTIPVELRQRPEGIAELKRQASGAMRRFDPHAKPTRDEVGALVNRMGELIGDEPDLSDRETPIPGGSISARASYRPFNVIRQTPLPQYTSTEPVFLVVSDARYHVYECGPLLQELRQRGVNAIAFRGTGGYVDRRQIIDWGRYTDELVVGSTEVLAERGDLRIQGCFMLNDWSTNATTLMELARRDGGVSFAKVEGVQDFEDVDTNKERYPYKHADVIFAQGRNDEAALDRPRIHIVGNSRLEKIWREPACGSTETPATVNFNFTYGVMTEAQQSWIDAVMDSLDSCGVPFRISAHWKQKFVSERASAETALQPIRYLLRHSSTLISRFSTVAFEAMARGVPFIYFNPHGELVPTFKNPNGAYLVANTEAELHEAIDTAREWIPGYRERSRDSFLKQVDVDPDRSSASRTADVVVAELASLKA